MADTLKKRSCFKILILDWIQAVNFVIRSLLLLLTSFQAFGIRVCLNQPVFILQWR